MSHPWSTPSPSARSTAVRDPGRSSEDALAGRDVLAKSPTGSGKTLAFALPLIERTLPDDPLPAALVLVPTRELAAQVTEEFATLAAPATCGWRRLRRRAVARPGQAARAAHILVATPGRLTDLIQRGMINLGAVQILVLDEADRMLDMGFKPQVDRIVRRLPRSARRCSSRPRSTARWASGPRLHHRRPRYEVEPRPSTVADRPPVRPGHARQQARPWSSC